MINASNAFKNELYLDRRNYLEYADITLSGGKTLNLTSKDFWQGGMSLDDAVSGNDVFEVGAAIVNSCSLTIENIDDRFSEYDFLGAKVVIYIGMNLPDGTTEKIRKGTYTVNEPKYNGATISLNCQDNMAKFDRVYSDSKLTYPATLDAIVRDACTICGVALQTQTFPHNDFVVQTRPTDEAVTFREVISWAAQIAGCFCRCDVQGRLELKWYNQELLEKRGYDGGIFDKVNTAKYTTGDNVDGGTFNPWNTGDTADGGTFEELEGMHHIYSHYSSPVISTDDVVITGVKVLEKAKEQDEESGQEKDVIVTYLSGTDGYVVCIENNELIQGGKGLEISNWLGEQLIGFRFRKASLSHASDPTIEAGDIAVVTDRKLNTYPIIISSTKFSTGGAQSTESSAENPSRNSAARFSVQTKNYVEYRKDIEKERTEREKAQDELKDRIDSSSGLYSTEQVQPDGSKIFYMHDRPTLEESKIVWKMTAEAWGVSTDGGKSYNAGMTVDGDTIVRILTAVGVNADWIKSGALRIEKNGNVIFLADADTKRVEIVADKFSLSSGETIDSIAQDKANAAVNAQTQEDIFNRLTQNGEKKGIYMVNGELYVNMSYLQTGSLKIAKGDKTIFLADADNKRVEIVADTFSLSSGATIDSIAQDKATTAANNALSSAKSYADTTAQTKANAAVAAQTQQSIFDKLTNGGQTQGIYLSGGKLYINADYIKTGTLKVADKSGKTTFSANTITGEVSIVATSFSLTSGATIDSIAQDKATTAANNALSSAKSYADTTAQTKANAAVAAQTQQSIFNKLTNGGKDHGVYLSDGKLYINAAYIKSGTLSASYIKGGTLTLGGSSNTNGSCVIKNASGTTLITLDNRGITLASSVKIAWENISGTPTIPTQTSQLNNNSGFITSASVPTKVSQLNNDLGFLTKSTAGIPSTADIVKIMTDNRGTVITKDYIGTLKVVAGSVDVATLSAITANLGTVTAGKLQSSDYTYSSGNFSSRGMLIDLSNKVIRTPKFAISGGNAYFSGSLSAASGTFNGDIANTSSGFSTRINSGSLYSYYNSTLKCTYGLTESSGFYKEGISFENTVSVIGEGVPMIRINSGNLFYLIVGKSVYIEFASDYNVNVSANMKVAGSFSVKGTKNRIASTENYRERLLYCYEMPSPMFGDIGEATTDENGECYIYLDDVFSETVSANIEYQVFLQKEGAGDVWIAEKNPQYFVVKGTENLKFAWEIKAKQKEYEYERLEAYTKEEAEETDYEQQYMEEIASLISEQEEMYYETA